MRRRAFIAMLGGAAVALPVVAHGQQTPRTVPLIGALWSGGPSAPITLSLRDAFLQGLREDGYIEGQTFVIEDRFYAGDSGETIKAANELVGLRVNVIMAGGTPAALAVKRITSSIPIVCMAMADPVSDGLAASLSRPGGNVTGNTFLGPELGSKRLQLLRELVPGITRIAGLQHPGVYSERTMRNALVEVQERARESGVGFQVFDVMEPNDFDAAFEAMVKAREDALMLLTSPMFYVNYQRLVDLAAAHRLPTMYAFRVFAQAGGLISYGADLLDLTRLAANYVAKILKGANPGDIPVEQPTRFELFVNLKTAKALGLAIPQSLLARADEVIE
jgi:putative tryptophan/tyrosine transport system substrate-binding protein